jgi:glycerol kinase
VDGGACANNLLMQMQADVMTVNVERLENLESTAYGIALMAGLGVGIWASQQELVGLVKVNRRFEAQHFDQKHYEKWQRTVQLAIDWAS